MFATYLQQHARARTETTTRAEVIPDKGIGI